MPDEKLSVEKKEEQSAPKRERPSFISKHKDSVAVTSVASHLLHDDVAEKVVFPSISITKQNESEDQKQVEAKESYQATLAKREDSQFLALAVALASYFKTNPDFGQSRILRRNDHPARKLYSSMVKKKITVSQAAAHLKTIFKNSGKTFTQFLTDCNIRVSVRDTQKAWSETTKLGKEKNDKSPTRWKALDLEFIQDSHRAYHALIINANRKKLEENYHDKLSQKEYDKVNKELEARIHQDSRFFTFTLGNLFFSTGKLSALFSEKSEEKQTGTENIRKIYNNLEDKKAGLETLKITKSDDNELVINGHYSNVAENGSSPKKKQFTQTITNDKETGETTISFKTSNQEDASELFINLLAAQIIFLANKKALEFEANKKPLTAEDFTITLSAISGEIKIGNKTLNKEQVIAELEKRINSSKQLEPGLNDKIKVRLAKEFEKKASIKSNDQSDGKDEAIITFNSLAKKAGEELEQVRQAEELLQQINGESKEEKAGLNSKVGEYKQKLERVSGDLEKFNPSNSTTEEVTQAIEKYKKILPLPETEEKSTDADSKQSQGSQLLNGARKKAEAYFTRKQKELINTVARPPEAQKNTIFADSPKGLLERINDALKEAKPGGEIEKKLEALKSKVESYKRDIKAITLDRGFGVKEFDAAMNALDKAADKAASSVNEISKEFECITKAGVSVTLSFSKSPGGG